MKVKTGLVEGGLIVASGGYSFSSLVPEVKATGRRAYKGGPAQQERRVAVAEPEQEDEWSVDEGEVEETEQTEQEEETPEAPESE